MCDNSSDCNNKGFCNQSNDCDMGWYGEFCEYNLKTSSPSAFIFYRVIFLIVFSIIALMSFIRLYKRLQREKHFFWGTSCLFVLKSVRSPYNLAIFSIFWISIIRIFWLAIDPFGYHQIFHRSVERFFFETAYSFLFMIYAIVLWVWFSIYKELTERSRRKTAKSLGWFKFKLKIFVVIVIICQITTSILKGFITEKVQYVTYAIYAFLVLIFIIVILEYCIYGFLLYRCIVNKEKKVEDQFIRLSSIVSNSGVGLQAFLGKKDIRITIEIPQSPRGSPATAAVAVEEEIQTKPDQMQLPRKSHFYETERNRLRETNVATNPEEKGNSERNKKAEAEYLDQIPKQEGNISPRSTGRRQEPGEELKKQTTLSESQQTDPNIAIKAKEIALRHKYHFRTVEIRNTKEDISPNASVILDNDEEIVWDFIDDFEQQKQMRQKKMKALRREETKIYIEKLKKKTVLSSYSSRSSGEFDTFQLNLLSDRTYLENHKNITKYDKMIMKKILGLTIIAICLEFLFMVIALLITGTAILRSPSGMILCMWLSGFLEIFAVIAIICLFSLVETQTNDNLRLIMKIGQNKNRINRLYGFVLPDYLRKDESKKKLEKSINQLTARYLKST